MVHLNEPLHQYAAHSTVYLGLTVQAPLIGSLRAEGTDLAEAVLEAANQ